MPFLLDYFADFFLLMLDMSAACCLINFILFLAVEDRSPGPWPEEADTELEDDPPPVFILEDVPEDMEDKLSTGGPLDPRLSD